MTVKHWVAALAASAAVLATGPGSARLSAQPAAAQLNPAFEQLVDRYLIEVRGVSPAAIGATGRAATAAGPNDLSAAGFARDLETQRTLLKELRAIDRKTLTFDQDIDYRFLESILASNVLEDEKVQRWKQNPRVYLGFRPIAYKIEADPRSPSVRAAELVDDLKLLQARLANGMKNLSESIPRWIELSNATIDGAVSLLEKDMTTFASRLPAADKAPLDAEKARTLAALKEFRSFINTTLMQKPAGDWRIGAEVYNKLHELRYMFDDNDMHLRRIAMGQPGFTLNPVYHDWGWRQFAAVERALVTKAKKIDPSRTWLQIIRDEKETHPAAEQLVYHHLEAARASREWVIKHDLVTIPWKDDDGDHACGRPDRVDVAVVGMGTRRAGGLIVAQGRVDGHPAESRLV